MAGVGVLALMAVGCGDDTATDGAAPAGDDGGQAAAERSDGASGSGSLVFDGESHELTTVRCITSRDGELYWQGSAGRAVVAEIRPDSEDFTVKVSFAEITDTGGLGEMEVWEGLVSTESDGGAGEVDVSGDRAEARLDLNQVQVQVNAASIPLGPTARAEIDLTCPGD